MTIMFMQATPRAVAFIVLVIAASVHTMAEAIDDKAMVNDVVMPGGNLEDKHLKKLFAKGIAKYLKTRTKRDATPAAEVAMHEAIVGADGQKSKKSKGAKSEKLYAIEGNEKHNDRSWEKKRGSDKGKKKAVESKSNWQTRSGVGRMTVGTRFVLQGVLQHPEWNGQQGELMKKPASGLYQLRLDSGDIIRVNFDNMKRVPESKASDGEASKAGETIAEVPNSVLAAAADAINRTEVDAIDRSATEHNRAVEGSAGNKAPLSQSGYNFVAEFKDKTEVRQFKQRMLDYLGVAGHVDAEKFLQAPWSLNEFSQEELASFTADSARIKANEAAEALEAARTEAENSKKHKEEEEAEAEAARINAESMKKLQEETDVASMKAEELQRLKVERETVPAASAHVVYEEAEKVDQKANKSTANEACSAKDKDATISRGRCCTGLAECREERPTTHELYCGEADHSHGVSCWSTIQMCRESCQADKREKSENVGVKEEVAEKLPAMLHGLPVKQERIVLHAGIPVKLHGLVLRPELNGLVGEYVKRAEAGIHEVRLDSGEVVRVNFDNVAAVHTSQPV